MTLPAPVPASSFHSGDFVADVDAEDAVYFLLNVGDGDTQLIVLPEFRGVRRALVVDVATTVKLPGLIEELAATTLFAVGSRFSIVVGTHPHDDHIRGMPEFIDRFGDLIDEYWEPGYYHPTRAFFETMRALEDRRDPPAAAHERHHPVPRDRQGDGARAGDRLAEPVRLLRGGDQQRARSR